MHQDLSTASAPARSSAHREFFDLSPALLCTVGADGEMIEANESFLAALGYEASALPGSHFLELVHPDDRAGTREACWRRPGWRPRA